MKYFFTLLLCLFTVFSFAQLPPGPCAQDSIYRQFDFWVGEWEAYNLKGQKAGDSKISIILDSCVILEEWTSMPGSNGFVYKGKSFNTYNAITGSGSKHGWIMLGKHALYLWKIRQRKNYFSNGFVAICKRCHGNKQTYLF